MGELGPLASQITFFLPSLAEPLKFIDLMYPLMSSILGVPGGEMVKNLPPSEGDVGSIPGLGRSLK